MHTPIRLTTATVGFSLLVTACRGALDREQHPWEGIVYPDAPNLLVDVRLGTFESLEDCRRAAMKVLALRAPERGQGNYECGRDCRPLEGAPTPPGFSPMHVCEETTR